MEVETVPRAAMSGAVDLEEVLLAALMGVVGLLAALMGAVDLDVVVVPLAAVGGAVVLLLAAMVGAVVVAVGPLAALVGAVGSTVVESRAARLIAACSMRLAIASLTIAWACSLAAAAGVAVGVLLPGGGCEGSFGVLPKAVLMISSAALAVDELGVARFCDSHGG